MEWTKEPPTTPGLYAWCDGRGGAAVTMDVWSGFSCCNACVVGGGDSRHIAEFGGLWQPLHVELPPAYVPPQPPKVEWYSAKHQLTDGCRLLAKIGSRYIATSPCGGTVGDGNWGSVETYYTDIERVPDETTTR